MKKNCNMIITNKCLCCIRIFLQTESIQTCEAFKYIYSHSTGTMSWLWWPRNGLQTVNGDMTKASSEVSLVCERLFMSHARFPSKIVYDSFTYSRIFHSHGRHRLMPFIFCLVLKLYIACW